jgi:hypothetical protein
LLICKNDIEKQIENDNNINENNNNVNEKNNNFNENNNNSINVNEKNNENMKIDNFFIDFLDD